MGKASWCRWCGHDLKDNQHGLDQNDFYYDCWKYMIYMGSCTYCRECNSAVEEKEARCQKS